MSRQGKPREKIYKNIKQFWESEAIDWGYSSQVTIRDFFFRKHELNVLLALIPASKRILDIGCGNGFGTLVLSQKADYILGVDYSKTMIKRAFQARDDKIYRLREATRVKLDRILSIAKIRNVDFEVADVLNLNLKTKKFDVITGQRIFINLPTEDLQMKTLRGLREYAHDKTLLVLVEATIQGHKKTDEYRKKFGLPILEKYWHNNYVNENNFPKWKIYGWQIEYVLSFDTYALLSKVIYPAAYGQGNCAFLSGANEAAQEIADVFRTKKAVEEIGTMKMLKMYIERTMTYDKKEGMAIFKWVEKNGKDLPNWENLGHQKLIIAKTV